MSKANQICIVRKVRSSDSKHTPTSPWGKVFPVNTKERLTRTRSSNAVRLPKRSRAEQSCYTSSCHKDSHDRGRAKRKIFRTFDVDVLCERRESMRRRQQVPGVLPRRIWPETRAPRSQQHLR